MPGRRSKSRRARRSRRSRKTRRVRGGGTCSHCGSTLSSSGHCRTCGINWSTAHG